MLGINRPGNRSLAKLEILMEPCLQKTDNNYKSSFHPNWKKGSQYFLILTALDNSPGAMAVLVASVDSNTGELSGLILFTLSSPAVAIAECNCDAAPPITVTVGCKIGGPSGFTVLFTSFSTVMLPYQYKILCLTFRKQPKFMKVTEIKRLELNCSTLFTSKSATHL